MRQLKEGESLTVSENDQDRVILCADDGSKYVVNHEEPIAEGGYQEEHPAPVPYDELCPRCQLTADVIHRDDTRQMVDVSFIWDHLKPSEQGHKDRRQTSWGDKTKEGLALCLRRVVDEAATTKASEDDQLDIFADLLGASIAMRQINQQTTRAQLDRACDQLDKAIKEALAKGYSPA